MDRKSQKRKEREKKVREKKQRALQRELEDRRQRKREERLFEQNDELREQLTCEMLLATIDLAEDNHTRSEAKIFVSQLLSLRYAYEQLGRNLDDLFALAHGKLPRRYGAKANVERLASELLRNMRSTLTAFEARVGPLLSGRIGERVCATGELESRLRAACERKRESVQAWARQQEVIFRKLDAEDGQSPEEGQPLVGDDRDYDFALDSLIEAVTTPMEKIRQWQLGVPTDFYRDISQLSGELSVGSTFFFLRQLYAEMTAGELHPILQREPDSLGMIRFGYVLQLEPEKYLPDPAYLEEQKALARQLNRLEGGDSGLKVLVLLHASGVSYGDALAKLERLSRGQRTFGVALEMLTSCGEWGAFLLDLCGEHPSFLGAYDTLRATGHTPEQSAVLLRDYGDYRLGDATLAEVILRLGRRPEAVQLLVANALCFCCGEGAEDLVALMEDLPKATKALRHYLSFARSEEPYKQLAVLRYLKHRGVQGLEDFTEHLARHRDERVGVMLQEGSHEAFLAWVAAAAELVEATAVHPLRDLASFDLIARYDFTAEIVHLPAAVIDRLDAVLHIIRGSRYESVLLGQANLRQRFVACLLRDAERTAAALSHLPPAGNPYQALREILAPAAAEPPPTVERQPGYARIVLIAASVDQETIAYLSAALGIPVHLISVDASSNRFNAIRQGDVVVYDTTRTSHPCYYRAKNLATRRGAAFRHASRTHRDALVELIRS